jgi:hypothetical protein
MVHRAVPVVASAAMAAKPPLYADLNGGTTSDAGAVQQTFGETLRDIAVPKAPSVPN